MKKILTGTLLTTYAAITLIAGDPVSPLPTNAPARIVLSDQFEKSHTLAFPNTNVTLLTIADHDGSKQIAGWVTAVKEKFPAQLNIQGIADVSAVPRPLQGWIRRKFQKAQTFPVMMDWAGDTVKAFGCVSDRANVFVLDGHGRILKHCAGAADPKALAEVYAAIETALKAPLPTSPPP